jgi:hypothetical protein
MSEEKQEVQLGLNDIAAVVQIIDVVTKRGAFEGPELEAVGVLRNRFAAFVQSKQPVQEEAAEPQIEKVQAEAVYKEWYE